MLPKVLLADNMAQEISGFKFAEHVQMKSRLQAEDAKKQQETFIDMTS